MTRHFYIGLITCLFTLFTFSSNASELPDYSLLSTKDLEAKAESGDSHAYYTLGYNLLFGSKPDNMNTENLDDAIKLIRKADDLGHVEAPSFMAIYYFGEFGGETNYKKAKQALLRGIDRDSKGAKLNFITRYINSKIKTEANLAQRLLIDSTDDPDTINALSPELMQIYSFGTASLKPDLEKGRKFAKICSEGKRDYAQCNFLYARYLQNGWGGDKNLTKSTYHFKRAAEANDPRGQWNYGMALIQGIGTDVDLEEAYRWMKKSAENDYLDGLLSFAVMNAVGQGTEKNNDLAFATYEKAAKRGSAHALRGMSLMIMEGQGTPKNKNLGLAALLVADENGDRNARQLIAYLFPEAPDLKRKISSLQKELAPQIAQVKSTYNIQSVR